MSVDLLNISQTSLCASSAVFESGSHPFGLMMNPEQIIQKMERSTQLGSLRRRVLRPLDKPLIPFSKAHMKELAEFDAQIDAEEDNSDSILN
jgi:hypothetical protein